jgi:hypothetical protein
MGTTIELVSNGQHVGKLAAARSLADHQDGRLISIIAIDGGNAREQIGVHPRRKAYGETQSARVNLGGIEAVSAVTARRYAEMIGLAAELIELSDMIAAEAVRGQAAAAA